MVAENLDIKNNLYWLCVDKSVTLCIQDNKHIPAKFNSKLECLNSKYETRGCLASLTTVDSAAENNFRRECSELSSVAEVKLQLLKDKLGGSSGSEYWHCMEKVISECERANNFEPAFGVECLNN